MSVPSLFHSSSILFNPLCIGYVTMISEQQLVSAIFPLSTSTDQTRAPDRGHDKPGRQSGAYYAKCAWKRQSGRTYFLRAVVDICSGFGDSSANNRLGRCRGELNVADEPETIPSLPIYDARRESSG